MNRDDIFEKLQVLVSETLEVDLDDVTPDSSLDDLGADSFAKLELVTAMEDAFDVTLEDEVLESIDTVDDAINAIAEAQRF